MFPALALILVSMFAFRSPIPVAPVGELFVRRIPLYARNALSGVADTPTHGSIGIVWRTHLTKRLMHYGNGRVDCGFMFPYPRSAASVTDCLRKIRRTTGCREPGDCGHLVPLFPFEPMFFHYGFHLIPSICLDSIVSWNPSVLRVAIQSSPLEIICPIVPW
jgi:hypothetical protein